MCRRVHAPFLVVGFCLIALAGPAVAQDKEQSPFAGKYSGEWTFKSSNALFPNNQRGNITLSVAASGRVTGTLENTTFGSKAVVKGFVDEDGGLDVTYEFPDQSYTLKGTVNKTKQGGLRGTVGAYSGKDNPVGTVELDLPPK